ncbi:MULTISPECIES: cation:proton antiporter [Sulfitobacter]|uniref:Sodium/proton antiporter, CPA1 family n=3 Tax=Sulfitobacter TaxID=60136 RepID=A0A1H2USB4_9RHOB|nr:MULTISPECIES: sodium:proton antiporter [Sulfitobacter]KAJ31765.1 sodium/hydrogen exchanger [Sulfitobacter pontiacus 3SOLIMAR09]SDW58940.1 sodium/proton antiporter, CPA1 family [Sulfitobacter pontiacus]
MATETLGALNPVTAIALVGAIGVGSQWIAWRLRMPAIVLMLVAGILIGPVLGIFDPARDIGPLMGPMISIAVAIILFEGGLSLNFHTLQDAVGGVRRLVYIGAPLGWLMSALSLHYVAGLSWSSSAVFGGIMIVTGPTVIAPLLRTARLSRRPATLLQWEAILNDPIGALAAVLAFEVVIALNTATTASEAMLELFIGAAVATAAGVAAGIGLSRAFKRGWVPEYMKVPVLFALLLGVFAASDAVLHESGLLAVTIMGIVIANSKLPSYEEMRRFKEHATVLLVSGVFILLAAGLDVEALGNLDWRAAAFVAVVVLVARPVTVFISLVGSGIPFREKLLVALTGPRGVVLVAVAGLFGERLLSLGFEDAALIAPLAFALVAVTVVVNGFTLAPFARLLGLTGADTPGVVIIGGSDWTTQLAEVLKKAKIPVLMTDPNFIRLRKARAAGIDTFSGDILSEAAEQRVELVSYATLIAATDNDAYNTLVTTDLAPEFGRENVFQVMREKSESSRHQLPRTLGGRPLGLEATHAELRDLIAQGWRFRSTRLSEEFTLEDWRAESPEARLLAQITTSGEIKFMRKNEEFKGGDGIHVIALRPPEE